jgi:spore coat polysaccharide biosynthesis protein SpsF
VKLGVIIQARMGSTRLPGKVLTNVHDKYLLDHIIYRLSFLKHLVTIVVATSTVAKDDAIDNHCSLKGIHCFRGSENDVLKRYYDCAVQYGFDNVVRLTADNPFTDIEELDRLISMHLEGYDYCHSFASLPIGVGAEIFNFQSLRKSYLEGFEEHHREHVDEYMLENPAMFKTGVLNANNKKKHPEVRLTVDTPEDLRKASFIVKNAKSEYISTEECIDLCSRFV